jgi:hypothetical protein
VLEPALARLRAEHLRLALVQALGVQARLAMRQGHWQDALGALSEGLDVARAMPYPYAEARLLHVAGLLHAAQGAAHLAQARWADMPRRWVSRSPPRCAP